MGLKSVFAVAAGLFIAAMASAQQPSPAPLSPVVPPALTPDNVWNLDLSTGGRVSIQLRPDIAPKHVERIKTLTRQNFYNGLIFHRVIESFMAQGGDPTGTGTGGSQLPDLAAEFNILPHVRGTVSAARSPESVDSANSQFFIMLSPRLALDNHYSAFGRVISGMNFVDAIPPGEPPAEPARILRASIGSDNIAPPVPGEVIPGPLPVAVALPPAPAPVSDPPPAPVPGLAPAPAEEAPSPVTDAALLPATETAAPEKPEDEPQP